MVMAGENKVEDEIRLAGGFGDTLVYFDLGRIYRLEQPKVNHC